MLFPGHLDGKESASNMGDPGSIPGLGRSPGEGNGYPFPFPADLLNPRIIPRSPVSQTDILPSEPPGKPQIYECLININVSAFEYAI